MVDWDRRHVRFKFPFYLQIGEEKRNEIIQLLLDS
jgi:hypothetical protein